MNETGKRRLKLFLAILFGIVLVYIFIGSLVYPLAGSPEFLFWALAGLIAYPIVFYIYYHSKLHMAVEKQALATLGFSDIATLLVPKNTLLSNYKVSQRGRLNIASAYTGKIADRRADLVDFDITVGSGKNSITYKFKGIILHEDKFHLPVQIYDKDHPVKPWFFNQPRSLESEEFHEWFSIYAGNEKDAFYQLDPDSMSDLIDLRKEWGHPINMEFFGQTVFFYTRESAYRADYKGALSFTEVMNGQGSQADIEQYKNALQKFLRAGRKMFEVLNIKFQKT